MLRISKLTDYGVVLASHLATLDGPRSVRELADDTAVPQPTTAKVLKALAKGGIVSSTRGAHGGYALAAAPADINIAQVIAALEGPIAVTECTDDTSDDSCSHEDHCGVRGNWQRINAAVHTALEAVSLADMAQRAEAPLITLSLSAADADAARLSRH
ncbi:MAG: SUF system Fe-S cluster assembly regulator [Myxococcota bacterium]